MLVLSSKSANQLINTSTNQQIIRGVAPTALLSVIDALFYHSVAPMALIQYLNKMHVGIKFQINKSTYQLINLSTYQLINLSTYQLINLSTYQLINSSTHQLINTSNFF
jgi:hypothetical protein